VTRKQDASFSEEKEAKKLLSIEYAPRRPDQSELGHARKWIKVFCFFFAKKKRLSYA
jgi:hypothetical protein